MESDRKEFLKSVYKAWANEALDAIETFKKEGKKRVTFLFEDQRLTVEETDFCWGFVAAELFVQGYDLVIHDGVFTVVLDWAPLTDGYKVGHESAIKPTGSC